MKRLACLFVSVFLLPEIWVGAVHPQAPSLNATKPALPKTWDDAEMAALEIPLANPIGSPKQVPADYYYRVPVRPIYKSYPVYAAGHEPTGYLESLKHKDPIIYWDDKGHAPTLETEADWINAGEAVFDAPIGDGGIGGSEPTDLYVRDPKFLEMTGAPIAGDGTLPYFRYVVKKKGDVEIGVLACGMCHTRVMPDGTVLKGSTRQFPLRSLFRVRLSAFWRQSGPIARTKSVSWLIASTMLRNTCGSCSRTVNESSVPMAITSAGVIPNRMVSLSSRSQVATSWRVCSMRLRMPRARARSKVPALVGSTPRECRTRSATPRSSSSCRICIPSAV